MAPAVGAGVGGAAAWVMTRFVVGVLDQSVWAYAAAVAVLAVIAALWVAVLVRERRRPPNPVAVGDQNEDGAR